MHEHPNPHQRTAQKSAPTSSGCGDLSNTPNSPAPTSEWVPESEAAKLLAIKNSTLRSMRRDGRLDPGVHYIFSTGTPGGPVLYEITAITATMAQRTKEMVAAENQRREELKKARNAAIEIYSEDGMDQLVAEVQS